MKTLKPITSRQIENIFNKNYKSSSKVCQFGQSINNPNLNNENLDIISTLDILKDLYNEATNVYNLSKLDMHNLDGTNFEYLQDYETEHVNTYNWSAPITNDLDFKVFKINDKIYLDICVQNGYSDARCGYQIGFLFEFDNLEHWYECFENIDAKYKSFDIDGFSFDFDIFNEGGTFNVYNESLDIDLYDVYIGDFNDCVNYIENKEYLN